jgi:hypothetical protein
MRLWNFLTKRWWLIYGVGLGFLIFYVMMLILAEPSPESDNIIYTPIVLRTMMGQFLVVQAVFLVLGSVFYSIQRSDWGIGILMILLPLLVSGILASTISEPRLGDRRLLHESSAQLGEHVYNLAGYHAGQLVAYECDSLDIVCRVIYRGARIISLDYKKECDVPPQWVESQNSIALIIRCENVFSYSLSP